MASVSFSDLGLERRLVHLLEQQGITEPFEVQRESIPDIMLGRDVCCRAPTGSGKTLAFGLPLISRCRRAQPHLPTSLILTPTRELAEQICSVLKPLAHEADLRVLTIYGGTSYVKQRRALERGVDIVVACPGRLLDLMHNGVLGLEDVDIAVIDEADRMADMGFMEPVCEILDHCSNERQTILFSATLDEEVDEIVANYMYEAVTIEVGPKEVSMDTMQHISWLIRSNMKSEIAREAVRKCGRSIIFCRTRAGVDRVGYDFNDNGLSAAVLHGGLSQRERNQAMQRFSDGECIAMIATDVAARGIDIQDVACIIHYDPPENGKAYKHRSGRTARAGAQGIVISLVQKPQKKKFIRMQRSVGVHCEFTPPDFGVLPETEVGYFPPPQENRNSRNNSSRRNDRYGGRNGGRNGNRNGGRNENRNGGRNENRNDGRRNGGRNNNHSDGGQRNGGRNDGQRKYPSRNNHNNRSRNSGRGGQRNGGDERNGGREGQRNNQHKSKGQRNYSRGQQ